ncbi:hypothetical protein LPB136_05195 [Tenacibaculum todarodis]|uniref:Lipoprotein n=1 Tax=Tenacibaculum todarodis TaxID=1850252 RepID=A0A1L3JI90_9FLAO|nr:hypothetical protein [Tenacibaculum todarodis]APG64793.1 hypothetical protein LPB136_05195 [Tenacibaculum todarodis]
MNKIFLSIFLLIFSSCDKKVNADKGKIILHEDSLIISKNVNQYFDLVDENISPLDTILEENTPNSLDLNKHQLFIDTTKTSKYFQFYKNWKPNIDIDNFIYNYPQKLKSISKKIDFKDFSNTWFEVKNLNDKFVIYDPCDGNTLALYFSNNKVVFVYRHEPDVDVINKIISINENEIVLDLLTHPNKSNSGKAKLSIKKTKFKNVCLLSYSYDSNQLDFFVTSKSNVSFFNIVVNNCPKMKRQEYNFEKDFEKDFELIEVE